MFQYLISFCSDEDICIVLGNALDHAVESAMETEPEKRYINFNMVASSNVLTLVIRNVYNRFTPEKKPDEKHNLGLSLIRKAAARYHGEVLIEKDENECSLSLFFYENWSILQNAIE
ncbi:MAG: GHKL domain-containing protein [Hungatella sp.]|jgi:sensor histidine kinase regulating citrate/malate metabolism|nr:GHKL domain-containing protein [Hungatella sp.]